MSLKLLKANCQAYLSMIIQFNTCILLGMSTSHA